MDWPNGLCPGKCSYPSLKCKDKGDGPSAPQSLGGAGGPRLSTSLSVDLKSGHVHVNCESRLHQESDLVSSHFEGNT